MSRHSIIALALPLLCAACGSGYIDDVLQSVCRQKIPRKAPRGFGGLAATTLDAPGAVCNDGSPGRMYVRRATDPEHVSDWVIYLEGGGFCDSWHNCTERWCGLEFDATKMTSRFSPGRLPGRGLLSPHSDSAFSGYNHAMIYYCSSDSWLGQSGERTLRGPEDYFLEFEGHTILMAGLDRLDQGALSDDGTTLMPDLTQAEQIIWAGSSAGAVGAMHHLDLVADRYPDADVVGLFDAQLNPAPGTIDPGVELRVNALIRERWEASQQGLYSAFTDPDCSGWRCMEYWDLQLRRIQTPYFVRRDLYDMNVSELYLAEGLTPWEYAASGEATMRRLVAERGDVFAFGPACGVHAAAASDAQFFDVRVTDARDPRAHGSTTFHDALAHFVQTREPGVIADTAEAQGSLCSGSSRLDELTTPLAESR